MVLESAFMVMVNIDGGDTIGYIPFFITLE